MSKVYLNPEHQAILTASAISDEVSIARGYRTVTEETELKELGFTAVQRNVPGLLLPLWSPDGLVSGHIYRPDNPRVKEDKSKRDEDGQYVNKVIKYEMPKGYKMRLDCPPLGQPYIGDPKIPLYITEGQKKGDAIISAARAEGARVAVIALMGVFNWRGQNELGGSTVLADWEFVALKGREIRIVFDSDVQTNPNVQKALQRLTALLTNKQAHVSAIYLPGGTSGHKLGVDDWLAQDHTFSELEALVQLPKPELQAAPPTIELLDEAPASLTRPVALIGGQSYVATWLHIRKTARQAVDRKQNAVVSLAKPQVTTSNSMYVIRRDGRTFDDGGHKPLEELGLETNLPLIPQANLLWSAQAVKRYVQGKRPNPEQAFSQIVENIERFIDFDRSLADQRTMAEFLGCYIMATWFLDAFNVVGFLWPNGERGSGKTNLLLVVTRMAYLGQVVTNGGSFASLRDLADYGATLAFDDAEDLSDPGKSDPDKRALLLSGNRRGTYVTLKEANPDGTWRMRYVNAFSPRLFSAIRLPDAVLASRTIVIPLIKTLDVNRANADPADTDAWPHNPLHVKDDLYALALAHLPEMPAYDKRVGKKAILHGRSLQPWRAVLAVAWWLSDQGVSGLLERMEKLAQSYQIERADLEIDDFPRMVVRALIGVCHCAIPSNCAILQSTWVVTASHVAEKVSQIIAEDGDSTVEAGTKGFTKRVGHVLGKFRLTKAPRPGGKGPRRWNVTASDLMRWAQTYGLTVPEELQPQVTAPRDNGTNGTNGTMAQVANDLLEGVI